MDPDKSIKELKELFQKSKTARGEGKATWFEVIFPDMTDAFFVVAECGQEIPLPDIEQNGAAEMTISLVISQYKGLAEKVAFTGAD